MQGHNMLTYQHMARRVSDAAPALLAGGYARCCI